MTCDELNMSARRVLPAIVRIDVRVCISDETSDTDAVSDQFRHRPSAYQCDFHDVQVMGCIFSCISAFHIGAVRLFVAAMVHLQPHHFPPPYSNVMPRVVWRSVTLCILSF